MKLLKKGVIFLFLLVSVFFIRDFTASKNYVQAKSGDTILNESKKYFLADNEQEIDMSKVFVEIGASKFYLGDANLTLPKTLVENGNKLKATTSGVHEIKVKNGGFETLVYLVSKNKVDTEYTLYAESFDNITTLPSNFKVVNGTVEIKNESLFLNGMKSATSMVLLPDYLKNFSNYIIESDMNMQNTSNDSRWSSVMFRYVPNNYYQMAIRKNAKLSNGVEFASSVNGQWSVHKAGSFSEALSNDKWYSLKVDVKNEVVNEYVNDELIVTANNATDYLNGNIGFQTNSADVYFDNIKITLPLGYDPVVKRVYEVPSVYESNSNIINPATVIKEVNSKEELNNSLHDIRPQTLLFNIDSQLNIVSKTNDLLYTLEEVLEKLRGLIIPAFNVTNEEDAIKLVNFLKEYNVKDFFIKTDVEGLIKKTREVYDLTRGIFDFTNEFKGAITVDELNKVRDKTNLEDAMIAIIPNEMLTLENVTYLQKRLITVWGNSESKISSIYETILTGVNGVITSDYEMVYNIYESFPKNSVVRKPFMIAHRGIPSELPENTIWSATEAINRGADIIELDLHLTKDNEIVVYHDYSTGRLFDKDIKVMDATVKELQELKYNPLKDDRLTKENPNLKPNENKAERDRKISRVNADIDKVYIPTFEDYIKSLKDLGDDIVYFIEIKAWHGGDRVIQEKMRKVLEDNDMMHRAVVIGFENFHIKGARNIVPEISAGYLSYGGKITSNITKSVETVLEFAIPAKTTFNPSYSGLNKESILALNHRGITVWPWTIDYNAVDKYFLWGVGGITTDTSNQYEDRLFNFELSKTIYNYKLGDKYFDDRILALHYSTMGEEYLMLPEYELIDDGDTGVVLDRGLVQSAKKAGEAKVMVYFTTTFADGTSIVLYENIVTIKVTEDIIKTSNVVMIVSIVVGSLFIVGGAVGTTLLIKNKKKRELK